MKYIGWVALVLILIVLGTYYSKFGDSPTSVFSNGMEVFSNGPDVWGQFGDYLGGVLNPILSFLSIVILIKSINLQMTANKSLIEENKRQERLETRKQLEFRLFGLIDAQKSSFNDFSLNFPVPNGVVKKEGAFAINDLENMIITSNTNGIAGLAVSSIVENLDLQSGDDIYGVVRRFYLCVKLINDKVIPEDGFTEKDRKEYFEILVNMTDFSVVKLICIALVYLSWPSVKYVKDTNGFLDILNSLGLDSYMASFK